MSVSDESQIGNARREALRAAQDAGFDESDCGRVAIVATELATNLLRYAQRGELLIRSYAIADTAGVELISIDSGPGMPGVERCLTDGFSTGGTPGNGLGAVRRLATEFDIYSQCPTGTVVLARIQKPAARLIVGALEWGVINRPAPYEVLCGDTWRIANRAGQISVMIADGLGHGPQAAEAADLAGQAFETESGLSAAEFLTIADRRLRGTRGAAIAVAQWNAGAEGLRFAGIGNIAASIRSRDSGVGRGLVSHNGTVGANIRKVQQFDYEYGAGALLTMHSDGLKSRWTLDNYSGLVGRHPALTAAILYRDFRRDRDDITVCVIRSQTAGH